MSALERLRRKIAEAEVPALNLSVGGDLPRLIQTLERQFKSGAGPGIEEDLVRAAVQRFWEAKRFEALREAQLVSYGLSIKLEPSKPCILEDRARFQAVLGDTGGVGQWLDQPRCFRRCYQGLVSSYFTYDGQDPEKPGEGRKNWGDLRDFLWQHTHRIVDAEFNMDWVDVATKNRSLFSNDPCGPYAQAALSGRIEGIDEIREELGIDKNSWFQWELLMAQVRHATSLEDGGFSELIPNLLTLIASNEVVREKAMVQILDRYAQSKHPAVHPQLRDTAVAWWGNPWLPSDQARWGGVQAETRDLVAEWLRREFIEAFFTKLANDGVGDRRRANFWLRYAKSMSQVRFGLGSTALYSRDRDFVVLREKMKGLFSKLEDSVATNNAFIMTIGNLVAVEFGGQSNAFYAYDASKPLPFDVNKPLCLPVNARNSLKHENNVLRLSHQDGIRGFGRWEDWFAGELKRKFGISPDVGQPEQAHGRNATAPAPVTPPPVKSTTAAFTEEALEQFARLHGIRIRDNRPRKGNLRVDTHNAVGEVNRVLRAWGFTYNETGEFWWKT